MNSILNKPCKLEGIHCQPDIVHDNKNYCIKNVLVIAENERGSCVWEMKGRGYSALSWKLRWESEGLVGLSSTWISGILVSMVMLLGPDSGDSTLCCLWCVCVCVCVCERERKQE